MSYFTFNHKQVYYHESGAGRPLLFLHGNTASSSMYAQITERYERNFNVILIDFLGHGKSDRLSRFPADLWFYEAQQVIALLNEKQYADVSIIGGSGGAMVALNVALEAPEIVCSVIADSFEGERAHEAFTKNLLIDRERAKSDSAARAFYAYMHGPDWEQIVDCDTDAVLRHAKAIRDFFHKSLHELKADVLLTGSRKDEFMTAVSQHHLESVYEDMIRRIGHGRMHLFDSGGHPAMMTNQDAFYEMSMDFLARSVIRK